MSPAKDAWPNVTPNKRPTAPDMPQTTKIHWNRLKLAIQSQTRPELPPRFSRPNPYPTNRSTKINPYRLNSRE